MSQHCSQHLCWLARPNHVTRTLQGLVLLAPAVDITELWWQALSAEEQADARATGFVPLGGGTKVGDKAFETKPPPSHSLLVACWTCGCRSSTCAALHEGVSYRPRQAPCGGIGHLSAAVAMCRTDVWGDSLSCSMAAGCGSASSRRRRTTACWMWGARMRR